MDALVLCHFPVVIEEVPGLAAVEGVRPVIHPGGREEVPVAVDLSPALGKRPVGVGVIPARVLRRVAPAVLLPAVVGKRAVRTEVVEGVPLVVADGAAAGHGGLEIVPLPVDVAPAHGERAVARSVIALVDELDPGIIAAVDPAAARHTAVRLQVVPFPAELQQLVSEHVGVEIVPLSPVEQPAAVSTAVGVHVVSPAGVLLPARLGRRGNSERGKEQGAERQRDQHSKAFFHSRLPHFRFFVPLDCSKGALRSQADMEKPFRYPGRAFVFILAIRSAR